MIKQSEQNFKITRQSVKDPNLLFVVSILSQRFAYNYEEFDKLTDARGESYAHYRWLSQREFAQGRAAQGRRS